MKSRPVTPDQSSQVRESSEVTGVGSTRVTRVELSRVKSGHWSRVESLKLIQVE